MSAKKPATKTVNKSTKTASETDREIQKLRAEDRLSGILSRTVAFAVAGSAMAYVLTDPILWDFWTRAADGELRGDGRQFLMYLFPRLMGAFILTAVGLQLVRALKDYLDYRRYLAMAVPYSKARPPRPTTKLNISPKIKIDTSEIGRRPLSVEAIFETCRVRLQADARRLAGTSFRNLTLGIVFSGASLFVLAYPLVFGASPASATDAVVPTWDWMARHYIPRFGVGMLLQLVGYFFLRLYVSNEYDVKQNKNEITNLEMKMIAYQMALASGRTTTTDSVIKSLAETERNFILRKGERVVGGDLDPHYNDIKAMLDGVLEKLSPPTRKTAK